MSPACELEPRVLAAFGWNGGVFLVVRVVDDVMVFRGCSDEEVPPAILQALYVFLPEDESAQADCEIEDDRDSKKSVFLLRFRVLHMVAELRTHDVYLSAVSPEEDERAGREGEEIGEDLVEATVFVFRALEECEMDEGLSVVLASVLHHVFAPPTSLPEC